MTHECLETTPHTDYRPNIIIEASYRPRDLDQYRDSRCRPAYKITNIKVVALTCIKPLAHIQSPTIVSSL